jgi:nicotinic acid mononucleotide adenylyltransferase
MRFVGVCRPGFGEQLRREWKEYVEKNPLKAKDEDVLIRNMDDIIDGEPNDNNVNNNNAERHFILVETDTEDFSSTAVRECIVNERFDEMEKMLHPGVAEYIRAKNYFDYAEIAKNLAS